MQGTVIKVSLKLFRMTLTALRRYAVTLNERENGMRRSLRIVAVLLLAIGFSGCTTAARKEISMKSQSERMDVFKEVTAGAAPQAGFADLTVKASLKKPLNAQTEESFLLNIDGQAVTWNILGHTERAPQYDEKGQPNPERGEGIKYVLSKNLRLRPGPHRVFLALPAENVSKEVSVTLKDGEAAVLEFKPVYSRHRHPMAHFTKGIEFYDVSLNGTPR